MNPFIDLLERNRSTVFVNEDGITDRFDLLPGLNEHELAEFEASLPCAIPNDIRELLRFARGAHLGGGLEEIWFADRSGGLGLEQIFPHALLVAADGCGNYWVVDLTSESKHWGPVFYACHDAPVIVYQTEGLLHFIEEAIRSGNEPWKSEIDDVHEQLADRIWTQNPGVMDFQSCVESSDGDVRGFAESLDATWQFIDLRNAKIGDGFSWGRYGPKTEVRRFGNKRIFAYQKKSWAKRFLDAVR